MFVKAKKMVNQQEIRNLINFVYESLEFSFSQLLFLMQISMNISIFFRISCVTAAVSKFPMKFCSGKVPRSRPKLDPLAHALRLIAALDIPVRLEITDISSE